MKDKINQLLKDEHIKLYHSIIENNQIVIELIDKTKIRVCEEESEEFFKVTRILNTHNIKYQIYGYKRILI